MDAAAAPGPWQGPLLPLRRLRAKGPEPPERQAARERREAEEQAALDAALLAECRNDDDLAALATTVRRKHIHYTHVRTENAAHVQPEQMTKQQFWEHLAKCYKDVYPDPGSGTGSILLFGMVCTERHRQSEKREHREQHKHAPTFSAKQHYWNRVAKVSLEKYNVPLNAASHNSYHTMYEYLRKPTAKKPLSELDPEPYFSRLHPRGEQLQQFLETCRQSHAMLQNRWTGDAEHPAKKQRVENVFEVIRAQSITSVPALMQHALAEASNGNPALADFCTRFSQRLPHMVSAANEIVDSQSRAAAAELSLLDKLRAAATEAACVCGGRWQGSAEEILRRNGINGVEFKATVITALREGARRGTNIGLVGSKGCGKSFLVEPLKHIFVAASKPQRGSTFPLATAISADILLWQDYRHHEGTVAWTDLLSFLCGEGIGLRKPGEPNTEIHNKAPMIYTGRRKMTCTFQEDEEREEYDSMMEDRFQMYFFNAPIPNQSPTFPQCARCCAAFYLAGTTATQGDSSASSSGGAAGDVRQATLVAPAPADIDSGPPLRLSSAGPTLMGRPPITVDGTTFYHPRGEQLSSLTRELLVLRRLHEQGGLTDEEYVLAKARVLASGA